MRRITLLNMKGGCGKTTMATNLAAYYANKGYKTALTDYDPQGSSINWLSRRSEFRPQIYSLNASKRGDSSTRTWQLHPPPDTEISILDTPAGIDHLELNLIIDRTDIILIPVMPSHIDIHAAAHFIETLLIKGRARAKGKKIGLIANRVQVNTLSYQSLEKFLGRLDIPLVAKFRRVENYIHANVKGVGIHEFHRNSQFKDLEQWDRLINWIDSHALNQPLSSNA